MKKFAALLAGLAMVAFNALAAVNVNTATLDQLETLNGIGPVKAQAIIDFRGKNGPFKSVEELDKVPGIGQGVLGKIKTDATVSGQTTVKAKARPESGVVVTKTDPPVIAKPAKPIAPVPPVAPVVRSVTDKPAAKVDPVKPATQAVASVKAARKADKARKDAAIDAAKGKKVDNK